MSDSRTQKASSQECYIVLGDNRLVVITQGVPGYRRSPLDTGSRLTNLMIAEAQNKKLGITQEQASAMFKESMLIGTENVAPGSHQTCHDCVFEAYIYQPDNPEDISGVSLKLPATPYEILDGLERAHITNGTPYMEVLSEKLDFLSERM